jgi:creatinine amidohydrolase
METSVMRALHPDLVQMEHARDFRPLVAEMANENRHLGLTPAGKLAWAAQDMHPAGACGNASLATVEKGRAVIENAARQIVTLLREVDSMTLDHLDRQPDPDAR